MFLFGKLLDNKVYERKKDDELTIIKLLIRRFDYLLFDEKFRIFLLFFFFN